METRIQKWGNSLGVRIPRKILNKIQLGEGSCVNVTNKKKLILIESCPHETPSLERLMRRINPKNIHRETEWGNSYGQEIW